MTLSFGVSSLAASALLAVCFLGLMSRWTPHYQGKPTFTHELGEKKDLGTLFLT